MDIDNKLYAFFKSKALDIRVNMLSVGLGYTAVATSDGGIGLSFTYIEEKSSCGVNPSDTEFEDEPAILLLEKLFSKDPLERSMALALVNALNHGRALSLPDDIQNQALFDKLNIKKGSHVAMVGFFDPLIPTIEKAGAVISVIDKHKNIGSPKSLKEQLRDWADVLIMTSTTLLNNTAEDLLSQVGTGVKTMMIGPSTPLVPEAFEHLPVHMLAGMVPIEEYGVFKNIRHARGTQALKRFCMKKYWSSL